MAPTTNSESTIAASKGRSTLTKLKRPRPPVQVVDCGAAFPISTKKLRRMEEIRGDGEMHRNRFAIDDGVKNKDSDNTLLDWHDTVKQVRSLGTTGFVGKQKREHEDDEYKKLTGREKKKHQVPLPIVRGIKKKAAARQARQLQEAKDSGIILPKSSAGSVKEKKKLDSTNRVYGPAPSIGFIKKGVFRVKKSLSR